MPQALNNEWHQALKRGFLKAQRHPREPTRYMGHGHYSGVAGAVAGIVVDCGRAILRHTQIYGQWPMNLIDCLRQAKTWHPISDRPERLYRLSDVSWWQVKIQMRSIRTFWPTSANLLAISTNITRIAIPVTHA